MVVYKHVHGFHVQQILYNEQVNPIGPVRPNWTLFGPNSNFPEFKTQILLVSKTRVWWIFTKIFERNLLGPHQVRFYFGNSLDQRHVLENSSIPDLSWNNNNINKNDKN